VIDEACPRERANHRRDRVDEVEYTLAVRAGDTGLLKQNGQEV
jgi:hypothetical protein